jgi:putative addiction module killer protein
MEIREYVMPNGKAPFVEWIDKLRDREARIKIRIRLDRILSGNPGDCKSLGHDLYEMRIHYGPGYRVYYGREGSQLVLLLCGGNKSTQPADIRLANRYWQDYRSRSDEKKSIISKKPDSSPC